MRTSRGALLAPAAVLVAVAALTGQDASPSATPTSQLGQAVRVETGSAPIDVTVGHAAPYMFDFDGDGVRDLLVGESDPDSAEVLDPDDRAADPQSGT